MTRAGPARAHTSTRTDDVSPPLAGEPMIFAWRHPRPDGAQGRCIGRTDLRVDPRKARRLARRIEAFARSNALPREVFTSALRRCADVGRILRRKGWVHRIDPALAEADFGRWDGLDWERIDRDEIDRWCLDFADHRPGEGESLREFMQRVAGWQPTGPTIVVAHSGWMLCRRWLQQGRPLPASASDWPMSPPYCARWVLR